MTHQADIAHRAASDIATAADLISRAAKLLDRLPSHFAMQVESVEGTYAICTSTATKLHQLADLIDLSADKLEDA